MTPKEVIAEMINNDKFDTISMAIAILGFLLEDKITQTEANDFFAKIGLIFVYPSDLDSIIFTYNNISYTINSILIYYHNNIYPHSSLGINASKVIITCANKKGLLSEEEYNNLKSFVW